MSTQPLLLYDPLLFLLIYLNHIRIHKTLSYHSYSLYIFYLLILKSIYIYVHYQCLYIIITILRWVLSIYPFIKHYTIVVSIITIQFSHILRYVEKRSRCTRKYSFRLYRSINLSNNQFSMPSRGHHPLITIITFTS